MTQQHSCFKTDSFFLRIDDNRLRWDPVDLDLGELTGRARIHSDPKIDVAAVEVKDLLDSKINPKGGRGADRVFGLDKRNLPANNPLKPGIGDQALVVGYPSGYYDQFNLFPIVKSGVIASGWSYQFEGFPAFLIDAKLFPGSSGSFVISRPIDLANIDGTIKVSKQKQYLFLGVFSGERFITETAIELDDITILRKSGLNTGLVWYGDLVEEIITKGITIENINLEN
jgi:hypothetical protein